MKQHATNIPAHAQRAGHNEPVARQEILLYAPEHLKIPVTRVKGVGPRQAEVLEASKFAITSVQDLLQHYPRRHLDFSDQKSIREVGVGDEVTIIGEITKVQAPPPGRRKFPLKVTVADGTSTLSLVFFNQPWRAQQLRKGTMIAAKGKISAFRGVRQMTSPLVDVIRDAGEAIKIVPIYPATADLHTAFLRRVIRAALDEFEMTDPLAPALLNRHKLIDRTSAMTSYHFPAEMPDKANARRRLVFDELFTLQIGLAYRKRRVEKQTAGIKHNIDGDVAPQFLESLPFELTEAQRRANKEIASDMVRATPMHRLLQGEVGSGKTVVALYAAMIAVQSGYQAAIMAPTEVLAHQHYLTIQNLLGLPDESQSVPEQLKLGGVEEGRGTPQGGIGGVAAPIRTDPRAPEAANPPKSIGGPGVVLLTGSVPAARRRQALAGIADGSYQIVVGTHALIQEGVNFSNLGLAVIDEQHRFGVRQRVALKEKTEAGAAPDILIMTATPIPRTLAFTLYGDLDVSVLDELPKGRRPVATRVVGEDERQSAYDLVRNEVRAGHQAFVITPLIEESDKLQVKSAETEAKRLATEIFPDLRVGMMHGRMRPTAKESVMDQFRAGEIDVLISTTVVEVGVDVPNATVMLIEDADRFGLSQLHQLRGRIGRDKHSSTCILLTKAFGEENDSMKRLTAMASTNDGFKLAEMDLEFRGTGTILGERQSGFSDLKLTHLLRDIDILTKAREEAFSLIEEDPDLGRHPQIRLEMEGRFADRLEWLFRS